MISFSNAAFYQGQLLTVPERTLPAPGWTELRVASPEEAAANVHCLLERPISFHFLENGVYLNRRNAAEADYIAHLVRELLSQEKHRSIGIIAFSEAQQGEIEDALQRLGQEDSLFRDRLETELEREENGQFMGLLVKNLENIQGDERDVVILSVCYGRGPNGKMLMNFGPINQSGGEKRLNVAFSRAKQNMALISSIQFSEITNDFNDGARCLKSYLRYAQAASVGDMDGVRRVLRENLVRPEGRALDAETSTEVVMDQLAAELRTHGFEVDLAVGQSSFRCDLAVRRPGDLMYRAGVLVDTEAYYRQKDIFERDVMRPSLLKGFGWRIQHVLAKDWYRSRSAVLSSLVQFIEQEILDQGHEEIHSKAPALISEVPEMEHSERDELASTLVSPNDLVAKTDTSEIAKVSFIGHARSPTASSGSQWKRYFEFTSGTSSKFWEITLNNQEHMVRFGRIGSVGQQKTKTFINATEAEKDARRLINEKLAKGYVEPK